MKHGTGNYEFNFIFKDGSNTNIPFLDSTIATTNFETEVDNITKIIVNYNPADYTSGIRFFTKENKSVL